MRMKTVLVVLALVSGVVLASPARAVDAYEVTCDIAVVQAESLDTAKREQLIRTSLDEPMVVSGMKRTAVRVFGDAEQWPDGPLRLAHRTAANRAPGESREVGRLWADGRRDARYDIVVVPDAEQTLRVRFSARFNEAHQEHFAPGHPVPQPYTRWLALPEEGGRTAWLFAPEGATSVVYLVRLQVLPVLTP